MLSECIICGVETHSYYAGNPNLPLCLNYACEKALEDEINAQLQEAAEEVVRKEQ